MNIGVVVIGRNEGKRLPLCMESVLRVTEKVVYVDSGSSDDSVLLAKAMDISVWELSNDEPFSAARGRNEGFAKLTERYPELEYVQFVDGDCELGNDWLEKAVSFLDESKDVAVVCGFLHEQYPEKTVYNRICDIEWRGPVGEIKACGGIFVVRSDVYRRLGGMNKTVIAAEDDEFCLRVRSNGNKIVRIDADMAWHDADMTKLSQWWRRSLRAGYAYALGFSLHGRSPSRHFAKENRSLIFWMGAIPLITVILLILFGAWGLLFLSVYPLMTIKVFRSLKQQGMPNNEALVYSIHCMAAKLPQFIGLCKYRINNRFRRRNKIIEYK